MADDATLPVLLRDVLRHWKLAVAITIGALVGVSVYAQRLPNQYEGATIVSFSPRPQSGAGADIVRVTVPKYVEYVTARETVNAVAAALREKPGSLKTAVEASVAPDSGNLFIRVHLSTPARSAAAANAFAARTLTFAADDSLLQAVQVARALPDSTPSGPPRRLYEAAGVVIGLLAGAGAAFLLERGRPRVRTSQEISVVTGYPVVGHVPPTRHLRLTPVEALADPVVGASIRSRRPGWRPTSCSSTATCAGPQSPGCSTSAPKRG
jgi:capsular polysaccharide biosynthesis protein